MQSTFITIIELLNSLQMTYCLIGGFAVAVHGIPRFTDDLDFLVDPQIKTVIAKLDKTITSKNGSLRYINAEFDDPLGDVIQINLAGLQADLIIAKSPHEFIALHNANAEKFQGTLVNVVSPEDLIILKLHAGGPQDLYDVAGVLQVKAGQLDFDYLKEKIKNKYLQEKWQIAQTLASKHN